jgi:hypothetical protein
VLTFILDYLVGGVRCGNFLLLLGYAFREKENQSNIINNYDIVIYDSLDNKKLYDSKIIFKVTLLLLNESLLINIGKKCKN